MRTILALAALCLASCATTSAPPAALPVATADVAVAADVQDSPDEFAAEVAAPAAKPLPDGPPVQSVLNQDYLTRALQVIQSAETRLDIVQFEASSSDILDILLGAVIQTAQRGVPVRVLFDDEISGNQVTLNRLLQAGVNAKLDNTKVRTHTKLILADKGFLVGSTNWSQTSITKNNEANVLVRDATAIAAMGKYAQALWDKPSYYSKIATNQDKEVALYGDGDGKSVSSYQPLVVPLIKAAKTRILLCVYSLNVTAKEISAKSSAVGATVAEIQAAIGRGVEVRVILDQSSFSSPESDGVNKASGQILKTMGATVRLDPLDTITHAKFLIVDDTLVVGTNNWGYMGFVDDHEAGVRTTDATAVSDLTAFFEKIWAKSTAL